MYVPAAFKVSDLNKIHALIRDYPLGLLISAKNSLQVSPLPFILKTAQGEADRLQTHVAKNNPHWKNLEQECLIVFQGPNAYVSPSWYPSKKTDHKAVPTWNYALVYAWGRPVIHEDASWIYNQLESISYFAEHKRASPWPLTDAPTDFVEAQVKAVVGLEIIIDRFEAKWKMSQNREYADKQGVITGMKNKADAHYNPTVAKIIEES